MIAQGRVTTVLLANTAEAFKDYFAEGDLERDLPFVNQLGDRVALWRGKRKIALTSLPIPSLQYWKNIMGVEMLANLSPTNPTVSLSSDIQNDDQLLEQLVELCGDSESVEVIPYGTTVEFWNLADELARRYNKNGIRLLLPESPARNTLWLWKYFDSKAGFRHLIGEWFQGDLPARLPEGYIATNVDEATSVVRYLLEQGKSCICKPSIGVSGVGQVRFLASDAIPSEEKIRSVLSSAPYMIFTPVVVEELIQCDSSPSSEAFVPRAGEGDVYVTYNCEQTFSQGGFFDGVIIDSSLLPSDVESAMSRCAIVIGKKLQNLGYAGVFDLDFAVERSSGTLFLLEANLRRTGGTHAHEAAVSLFGDDYRNRVSVLCVHDLELPHPLPWNELLTTIKPFLYPMESGKEGLIVAKASSLPGSFGFVMFGESLQRLRTLQSGLQMSIR